MGNLKQRWAALAARYDALTPRERGLVLLAVLAVVYALWDSVVLGRLQPARRQLEDTLATAETRLAGLDQAVAEVTAQASHDPNAGPREQLARLKAELARADTEAQALARAFISPAAMVDVMRALLASRRALRLIALETAPATRLFPERDPAAPTVFRHELTIEFEGGYFDVLDYLRALAGQPLRWDALDYTVQAYPTARVRLKVHTLSFEREWLGA